MEEVERDWKDLIVQKVACVWLCGCKNTSARRTIIFLTFVIGPSTYLFPLSTPPLLMAQTESSSTFTSVIRREDSLGSWTRLGNDEDLSQLHAKFWRNDIANERRDWWNNHQGEMAATVRRNEIYEGCFVLDFNMDRFPRSRLWVRKASGSTIIARITARIRGTTLHLLSS
jgi:hypothetical protein